ncbi:hypothetical protein MHB50_08695 [Siminovitchia sp. FSL H7-0308]|uniref:Uncharacterized protein n=1 Tax=Siminovitchia thermophila TaxID=1245522 RepID=A0ABS2RBZ6_9BACI|nr:hypothetical protein [Siminovitchia thermophila]MBM7716353.1 hypothetical protein [Siminovitchia thermophila]ONK22008.1 hypothetical protein BLX87_19100 [Bacillus sp. VT-16-64]
MNWPTSLLAILAGYALLGITLLVPNLTIVVPLITVIQIIAVIVIVLFAGVIIFRALHALLYKAN